MILVITYKDGVVTRRSADFETWVLIGNGCPIKTIELVKGNIDDAQTSS